MFLAFKNKQIRFGTIIDKYNVSAASSACPKSKNAVDVNKISSATETKNINFLFTTVLITLLALKQDDIAKTIAIQRLKSVNKYFKGSQVVEIAC